MNDVAHTEGQAPDDRHTTACWWDHEQAGWVCSSAPSGGVGLDDAGASGSVDIRDMLVVHTALLREFRLAPDAVGRVPLGSRSRAAAVDRHLSLLCDLLHHHHVGEDRLLWPPLRARVPAQATAELDGAETQHLEIEQALQREGAARRDWLERVDAESRDVLVEALQKLHGLLAAHLDSEERRLLPLAAAYLTESEWRAVGEAGAAAIPRSKMLLVFGMFAYEGDPDVLTAMLAHAPAVPRLVVPLVAPRVYARRAVQLYETARP